MVWWCLEMRCQAPSAVENPDGGCKSIESPDESWGFSLKKLHSLNQLIKLNLIYFISFLILESSGTLLIK